MTRVDDSIMGRQSGFPESLLFLSTGESVNRRGRGGVCVKCGGPLTEDEMKTEPQVWPIFLGFSLALCLVLVKQNSCGCQMDSVSSVRDFLLFFPFRCSF
ncbi:hypothetical protein LZ32DRAFT_366436 [Colletotrichum eremochloae]|nr:hypothetical protein LZ32DRAFT_366436 [Colletotrichum eremochloae]